MNFFIQLTIRPADFDLMYFLLSIYAVFNLYLQRSHLFAWTLNTICSHALWTQHGRTALVYASSNGHVEAVKSLLKGAPLNDIQDCVSLSVKLYDLIVPPASFKLFSFSSSSRIYSIRRWRETDGWVSGGLSSFLVLISIFYNSTYSLPIKINDCFFITS